MQIAMRGLAGGLFFSLVAAAALAQQGADGQRRPGRESPRREGKLKVGDVAPGFTLATPDGRRKITLGDFRATRPVALIFGSYT